MSIIRRLSADYLSRRWSAGHGQPAAIAFRVGLKLQNDIEIDREQLALVARASSACSLQAT
jgi:hypothetical protein